MKFFLLLFLAMSFSNIAITSMSYAMSQGIECLLLSPEEARIYAKKGFMKQAWTYPKKMRESMAISSAGEPLLVKRIDREGAFYYIVPFNRGDKTNVVVIVDAKTGRFKETSCFKESSTYLKIGRNDAKRILMHFLEDEEAENEIIKQTPILIWKPCEQTQSPYEPLWRIQAKSKSWFIDQKGDVYDKIIKIKLKGGSM